MLIPPFALAAMHVSISPPVSCFVFRCLQFKQAEVDRFRLRMVRAFVEGGLPL